MAASRVTSIAGEVLATPVSEARVTSVAAEVLATSSSKARVSAVAIEALMSVTETPSVPISSHNASIIIVLGA
jgi:hypothetical protein